MAVRQRDQNLLVYNVVPALEDVERYLELLDRADALRLGDEEPSPLLTKVKTALDDIILRLHLEGDKGWKVVDQRVEGALERCPHPPAKVEFHSSGQFTGQKYVVTRKWKTCKRCWTVIWEEKFEPPDETVTPAG